MASNASTDLRNRLQDVELLITAHAQVVRLKRVQQAQQQAGDLAQSVAALASLVGPLTRGRPAEVGAINRGAFVLLSAHLEGFVEDLHGEAAELLLIGKVDDLTVLVKSAHDAFRNPTPDQIERLFNSIGMDNILDELRWQKASNKTIRKRLNQYIEVRNKIAHGQRERVTKEKVMSFKLFVELFAEKFDQIVGREIGQIIGSNPW